MTKILLKSAAVLALAIMLTSCGFHLRGNIPLSDGIKNMYVAAPDGSFKDQLESTLSRAGAEIAPNRAGADVVLNVTRAELKRTVGTIDERGKVSSYKLVFFVHYSLLDPDGKPIAKPAKLNETRRYDFDPLLVVESESEEAELLSSMEEDISLRVIRKLSTVTDYQPK